MDLKKIGYILDDLIGSPIQGGMRARQDHALDVQERKQGIQLRDNTMAQIYGQMLASGAKPVESGGQVTETFRNTPFNATSGFILPDQFDYNRPVDPSRTVNFALSGAPARQIELPTREGLAQSDFGLKLRQEEELQRRLAEIEARRRRQLGGVIGPDGRFIPNNPNASLLPEEAKGVLGAMSAGQEYNYKSYLNPIEILKAQLDLTNKNLTNQGLEAGLPGKVAEGKYNQTRFLQGVQNGGVLPEVFAKNDQAISEPELAFRAAKGDQTAINALRQLTQQKLASRPVNQFNMAATGIPAPQQGASGDAALAGLDEATAAKVKAIAEGRAPMPTMNRSNAAYVQNLEKAVYAYDPNYSTERAQARKEFQSGKTAGNIRALNTAVVHLDQFSRAAESLKNGNFRPGNEAYNYIAKNFGAKAVTNFGVLKNVVAGEMANALKGNATDIEIRQISEQLQAANSPEQLQGAVEESLRALGGKLRSYKEDFKRRTGSEFDPLLPSAKSAFDRRRIDPMRQEDAASTNLPRGNGKALDAQSAQAFLQAAGGDKSKARELARQAGWTF